MTNAIYAKRGTTVLLALSLLILGACNDKPAHGGDSLTLAAEPDSDLVLGSIAAFSLTERSGAVVTNETLAGQPYIASFFFTTCSGPCPALLGKIRGMQEELGPESKVRLVSITVDPETDTPEVLKTHAASFTADEQRWLFLTGSEDEIFGLMRNSFHLGFERLSEDDDIMGIQITHDTRLVVVDGEGQVRGYYDGTSSDEVQQALARARYLAGE